MIKKLACGLLVALIAQTSSASNYTTNVPYYCGFNSGFSHTPDNISNLVNSGSAIYQQQAGYLDWFSLFSALGSFSNTSSISTTGPDYVLQGVPARFKYDGDWFDWSSRYYTVWFGTSEFDSLVKKTSNFDNNAYAYLTFENTYGVGVVWSDGKGCMAKSVMVQKPPTISKISLTSSSSIRIKVNASIDQFSKYAIEGVTPKITYVFRNMDTNTSESVISTSKDITFTPRYNGDLIVTATISDGNYTASVPFGVVSFEGGEFCRTCGPIR